MKSARFFLFLFFIVFFLKVSWHVERNWYYPINMYNSFFYAKSLLMLVCPVSTLCKLLNFIHIYAMEMLFYSIKKNFSQVSFNSCPIERLWSLFIYNDFIYRDCVAKDTSEQERYACAKYNIRHSPYRCNVNFNTPEKGKLDIASCLVNVFPKLYRVTRFAFCNPIAMSRVTSHEPQ